MSIKQTSDIHLKLCTVLYILGLKTVIGELPPASSSLAANIAKRITGRLTAAVLKVIDCYSM